ncbi:tetratricopeptide repeat protein [Frankia sp. Cas3]|uniref:tetratricopeptide repeat protein n=1 Tax=Frankia sp. Cas3 TaxID=3073926 RepID=UPI003A100660
MVFSSRPAASASNLAGDLRALGEREAAVELYRQAWTGRRRRLGDDHPDTRDSAGKLDLLLEQLGRPPEARLALDRITPE